MRNETQTDLEEWTDVITQSEPIKSNANTRKQMREVRVVPQWLKDQGKLHLPHQTLILTTLKVLDGRILVNPDMVTAEPNGGKFPLPSGEQVIYGCDANGQIDYLNFQKQGKTTLMLGDPPDDVPSKAPQPKDRGTSQKNFFSSQARTHPTATESSLQNTQLIDNTNVASTSENVSTSEPAAKRPRIERTTAGKSPALLEKMAVSRGIISDAKRQLVRDSIEAQFPHHLDQMRNYKPISTPSGITEKQKTTYWMEWRLPLQQRVLAALFQSVSAACETCDIEITAHNTEVLMNDAVEVIQNMRLHRLSRDIQKPDIQKKREAIKFLKKESTKPTDEEEEESDLCKLLSGSGALQLRAVETEAIFQSVVSGIKEITGTDIDPDEMWKYCVMPITVNDLGDADITSPLLRFISESTKESYLYNMAKSWEYIVSACQRGIPLSVEFLGGLHDTCTGRQSQTPYQMERKNGNDCSLMLGDNLTTEGIEPLYRRVHEVREDYKIPLVYEETPYDPDYGKLIIDLKRDHTSPKKLVNLLKDTIVAHDEEEKNTIMRLPPAEQKDARMKNDLELASEITKCRIFSHYNPIVGHLLLNFLRLQRREGIFSLINYDVLDGHKDEQLLEKFHESLGVQQP